MARAINRLSARGVATIKVAGRHADGAGLYLHVDPTGAKRWVFVFQWRKKRKEMGLGPIHDVSLAEARDARDRARKLVREGINPIDARKASRGANKTFGELALEVRDSQAGSWRHEKTGGQWMAPFENHAPALLELDVAQVSTKDVEAALLPIWATRRVTAERLRGRIELVLDAAKAKGLRGDDNPARWKGHLDNLLARQKRVVKDHHKALHYADMPDLMERLLESAAGSAAVLAFTVLTAARTGEVTGATWREVREDLWTIPAKRMKAGREHRVPLVPAVLELLGPRRKPDDYLFTLTGGEVSEGSMLSLLKRMGVSSTVHGLRSTFRDWAGDQTDFPRELAEAALAHQVGDEAERAYRRSDALEKRRRLMAAWAEFCLTPPHDRSQPGPQGTTPESASSPQP